MSYVETVLQQSSALWKQQEEKLQKRLRLLVYGEGTQEESSLIGKLQQTDSAAEMSGWQEMSGAASGGTVTWQASTGESAEAQGTQWLREALGAAGTQGVSGGETRQTVLYEQTPGMADAELFSGSLERDARRYDGGFLLY